MSDETQPVPMNGRSFLRALAYALRAVPSGDDHPDLQHITFIGKRIVGADGHRWHVGYLLAPQGATVSVTRESAQSLLRALEYAQRESKRHGTFSVSRENTEVVIEYGAKYPIAHPLSAVDVGAHPPTWDEPVPIDAPLNPAGLGHIDCGHLKALASWWKSWDKDYGTCEIRGGIDGGPIRCDIVSGGEIVATAFALPADHPPAEIREPDLFNGLKTFGRSNLELDWSGDGSPIPSPVIIKIGDTELNVTGLGDPNTFLVNGPCTHRETTEACLPCTLDKVEIAKLAQEQEADDENDDEEPTPKGRRKKKGPQPFVPLDDSPGAGDPH